MSERLHKHRLCWIVCGALLVALTLPLLATVAQAVCGGNLSAFCSASFGLSGDLSAVGSPVENTLPAVDKSRLPMAGALFYVDYRTLETKARGLLERNMHFRADISPYRANNNFNKLVRQFDINSGFSAPYDDPDPGIPAMTLQQRIDQADADLREARDLYAFLAVYAPTARMRADDGQNPDSPGPNYSGELCAQAEDPNPPDPSRTGQVLDPVIDWCNFPARLRQSVREAAYLRMIFAQEFMVDALGLHFSAGALLGGDAFVRKEVAKLEAAEYQYELAGRGLREALEHPLSNGCLVSDFYTQAEWALLSRAAQGKEVAQHHIATRLSYLDIKSDNDIPRAHADAQTAFREASTDGYLSMISMAGMSVVGATSSSCAAEGANPDGTLIAEMALNMLDTRTRARELREGRNIFGMDVRFTPSRPYRTAFGSTDKGLWEQAQDAANLALQIQQQTENAERTFDLNQQELAKAVIAINNKIDNEIQIEAGCDLQNFLNEPNPDAAWHACIDEMIEHTQECDPTTNSFDACMSRTTDGFPPRIDGSNWLILVSDMRTARQDLRTAWLGVEAAIKKRDNILLRANTEIMRNINVRSAIINGAESASAFEAAIAAANCCTITIGTGYEFGVNPGAFAEAGLRPAQILAQAATEMQIEDANSEALVRNLFFDMAEAQGEIDIAVQQYQSLLTQFNGVVGQTMHDRATTAQGKAITINVLSNDRDADGDTLTIIAVSKP